MDEITSTQQQLVTIWSDRFRAVRMRGYGRVSDSLAKAYIEQIVEELANSDLIMNRPSWTGPGSASTRELERIASFIGGSWAALPSSGFELSALFIALREARQSLSVGSGQYSDELMDWLGTIALDAYAGARERSRDEKIREELLENTPLLLVAPRLPALLLVGRPDAPLVNELLGRLVLLQVRVDAGAVILDVSSVVAEALTEIVCAFASFVVHPRIVATTVIVTGLPGNNLRQWQQLFSAEDHPTLVYCDRFDQALLLALDKNSCRLVGL